MQMAGELPQTFGKFEAKVCGISTNLEYFTDSNTGFTNLHRLL